MLDFGEIVAGLANGRELRFRRQIVSIFDGQMPVVVFVERDLATVIFLNDSEYPIQRSSEFIRVDLVVGDDSSFGHAVGQGAQAGDASIGVTEQHP